uniref:Transcription elongation factor GreA n=1 Tax=Eiseniibacteriota bacterium TaxID=2212470 RepID=A0A832ML25_UNCEI
MPIRELLPPVLRGEAANDLSAASRAHLEALAHEAQNENLLPWLRDECAARLRQPHPPRSVEYLLAAACALHGETERAHQTLLALGEHLADGKEWEALAAVAERALALEETRAAALLLVRAHEGLGRDPDRIDALSRAWQIVPEDLDLALLLAVRLGEAGEGDHRRALLAELLPRFAEESRFAGLEEAALEFAEHGDTDGLVRLVQVLPTVATRGSLDEARQLLEIARPALVRLAAMGAVHASVRALVEIGVEKLGDKGAEPFRAALLDALRQGPAKELPDPEDVLAQSGLADRAVPVPAALARYDAVAALAPGRPVHHASFGAGRITGNDGENVFIDFAHARGHRMPHAAALRTLSPIAADDLRLVKVTEPAALERLKKEEPGTVVVRALQALGGQADAAKLKLFLVGSGILPAAEWTAFWRRARAAAEKDPRVDASRAFEQHYRLRPEGAAAADDAPLPALEPRKPVRSNLATVKKFLAQHPALEAAIAKRFGRYVERAMLDDTAEVVDRARAGLAFARWFPDRHDEWVDVLRVLWERGLSVTDLPGEEEQIALLESAHAAGAEADAILSALDSRFPAVREAAARFEAQLDDAGRRTLRATLLRHAPRYPGAALRAIEQELAGAPDAAARWELFLAAASMIEDRPRAALADKVLKMLEEGGPFERRLEASPPGEDARLRIRVLLRQWRSSDRYLFPVMELLERVGLGDEVEAVRDQRARKTDKLFAGVGEQAEGAEVPVMTRATWERLQQELERLQHELSTTIPATIRKARELGDLRENAEYHSAKQKQANVARLVASLQRRLLTAQFVEDMDWKDGVVGVGTEVTLESDDEVTSYWILGEGEHHLGDHVISFRTPVGRALMGRGIGDEVELGEGERRRRYRVVTIDRKLPPHSGAQTAAE